MDFNLSERIAHSPGLVGLPPLGLKPRFIVAEMRLDEINQAITRMLEGTYPIPVEWVQERNEIIEYLRRRSGTE